MQCPAGKCLRLRKMLARQLSDSLTNRKKAARHPQNCLASTDQHVHLQNAAVHVGTPHDIKCIIYSGRLIFNYFSHFPDGNPTTATETCTSKRSRVLTDIQKEKKNMIFCYFETIEQLSYGISWSELINNLLTQGVNIRKRLWSALRLTCGSSKSGHIEILRNWSATVLLPYSFTISCGGLVASLRNRAIFF